MRHDFKEGHGNEVKLDEYEEMRVKEGALPCAWWQGSILLWSFGAAANGGDWPRTLCL